MGGGGFGDKRDAGPFRKIYDAKEGRIYPAEDQKPRRKRKEVNERSPGPRNGNHEAPGLFARVKNAGKKRIC